MTLPQRPIIWTDVDRRKRCQRDHAHQLELARSARKRGRMDYAMHHLAMAAYKRGHMKTALRMWRDNDVRLIDGVAFVNSGGFQLREIVDA